MPKDQHVADWDARDRLLEELKQGGNLPLRMLYIRRDDGSALALGQLPDRRGLAMIDWRGESYDLTYLREPTIQTELFEQKAVGFGGMFGIGEKGANGWTLHLMDQGELAAEIRFLPYITSYADLLAKNDKFLTGKRKPREIPLWQLRPEDRFTCEATLNIWIRLALEGA